MSTICWLIRLTIRMGIKKEVHHATKINHPYLNSREKNVISSVEFENYLKIEILKCIQLCAFFLPYGHDHQTLWSRAQEL